MSPGIVIVDVRVVRGGVTRATPESTILVSAIGRWCSLLPALVSVDDSVRDEEPVFADEVLEAAIGDDEVAVVVVGADEVPLDESVLVPALASRPTLMLPRFRSFKPSQLLASAPCSASEANTSARTSRMNALLMISIRVPPFVLVLKIIRVRYLTVGRS